MALKVYDFECGKCKKVLMDQLVDDKHKPKCPDCRRTLVKLFSAPRAPERSVKFQPFFSDTFQRRINDREDLSVMRAEAKASGLTCVGHRKQKADIKAIKYNYENN